MAPLDSPPRRSASAHDIPSQYSLPNAHRMNRNWREGDRPIGVSAPQPPTHRSTIFFHPACPRPPPDGALNAAGRSPCTFCPRRAPDIDFSVPTFL
eukprot:CAMPEP_0174895260 /NCGR_PEP_ID=MMETSP0167-20121228/9706_1 /TAXON_ID=38298 /ORGANISM="Rhodella maculata, Strain CCMP736" /LENGTH=95 /DNA_ID=CAMNT_0016134545 /DNA_START=261 /DNA_END=548 /DNA_ORIENTATION=-